MFPYIDWNYKNKWAFLLWSTIFQLPCLLEYAVGIALDAKDKVNYLKIKKFYCWEELL